MSRSRYEYIMLHPSTKRLIDRLSEMTAQRKIEWASGEQPNSLVYDTEGYRVLLEGDPANLVLCDALGKELERAGNDLLSNAKHVDGGTYADILADMRGEAERIAKGTEDAIASVLEGLQMDGNKGEESPLVPDDTPVTSDEPFSTPIADAMEDNADELSAGSGDEIMPDLSPVSPVDRPDEIDVPASAEGAADVQEETEAEPAAIDHSYAGEPEFPDDPPAEFASEDAFSSEPQSPDEVIDQNEIDAPAVESPAFEAARFDDTPDVGKAVADLANQMNDGQPAEPPAAEPAFEAAAPEQSEAAMRAATISNFTTSSFGVPSGYQDTHTANKTSEPAPSADTVLADHQDPSSTTGEKPAQPTLEPIEEFADEEPTDSSSFGEPTPEETQAPVAPSNETTPVFRPGQTLSLSGLASNSLRDFSAPEAPQQDATPEVSAETAATPVPAESPTQEVESATSDAPEAPAAPKEENPEEASKAEQPTKRFNPWV